MKNSSGDQLLKLGETSFLYWFRWVVWDWIIIGLSFFIMGKVHNPVIWFLGMVTIGTRQHALAILGHDGTHGLACRNRAWNDLLTNVFCFLPFGANLNSYRVVHLQHHNHLGSDKDPELDFKKEMAPQWNLPITRRQLTLNFIKDLLGFGAFNVIIIMKSMPIRRVRDIFYVLLFGVPVAGTLILLGKVWILGIWFLCLFFSNWAVFRLRIWTEHVGTKDTHRIAASWWQRWLFAPHNTWYHYEHHKWPWVPFYNLPQARLQIDRPASMLFGDLLHFYSKCPPHRTGHYSSDSAIMS